MKVSQLTIYLWQLTFYNESPWDVIWGDLNVVHHCDVYNVGTVISYFFVSVVDNFVQNKIATARDAKIDRVVSKYEHAMLSKYPRARYVVGLDANFLIWPLQVGFTCFLYTRVNKSHDTNVCNYYIMFHFDTAIVQVLWINSCIIMSLYGYSIFILSSACRQR